MKDDSIFDCLDEYIAAITSRPVTSFYPSSASCVVNGEVVGECLRSQWYKWKNVPMDKGQTYRLWLSAKLGKSFEQAFLEGYRAKGLLKSTNAKWRVTVMGLPISGETDGITRRPESAVIECKSAYGKAFAYAIGKSPKPEHLCQIMVYLAVLGLDVCILPYGCRDDTGIRQGYRLRKVDIERMGIYFIKILARWKLLQFHLEMNSMPDRDYDVNHWRCRYCGYRKRCYTAPKKLDIVQNI